MNTKMRAAALVLAVLMLWSFAAGAAAAAESPVLDRIVGNGVLRVGLSGDQPPFNAKSRSGELIGLEVDLANLLARAFGVQVRFVQRDFPELLGALEAKEVDIVMSGMAITAERTQTSPSSVPICSRENPS